MLVIYRVKKKLSGVMTMGDNDRSYKFISNLQVIFEGHIYSRSYIHRHFLLKGEFHRVGGPAIKRSGNFGEDLSHYYLEGLQYDEEKEYWEKVNADYL